MVAKTPNPLRKVALMLTAAGFCCLTAGPAAASSDKPLERDDIVWLQRIGFGIDSAELSDYRKLGRVRFLDDQLENRRDDALPPQIASMIQGFDAIRTPLPALVAQFRDERKTIQAMPDGDAKIAAKKALRIHGRDLAVQAQQAELLHAIYGTDQLKEQMVWFWLNHFSVYAAKGGVAIGSADYEENVVRPRALGKFKDLLLATLESPAMLQFLDNAKNVKGKTNENYARELMELHTLGVGSGYSQQDVQQLALILTGAGLALGKGGGAEGFFGHQPPDTVRNGLFVFNPNRHDFSDKVFLGHTIKGSGANEIAQAVDLIVQQPACARFVSQQIAQYFVADKPPVALVDDMAKTFQRTDGDIAAVLRTMFLSKAMTVSSRPGDEARKFKDPTQFLVSAMRLAYDGQPISNAQPLVNWLNQMGEPVFGRITPDGWPLDGSSWSSSGQMAKRFDVAHMIGSGKNRLFALGDVAAPQKVDPPAMNNAVYQQTIEPMLSDNTRVALGKAASPAEWNTFLLSSPDFNYR